MAKTQRDGDHALRNASPGDPLIRVRSEWHLPVVTILKIIATLLIVCGVYRLWNLLLLTAVAAIAAIALHPLVGLLGRIGIKRGTGLMIVIACLIAMIGGLVFVMCPIIGDELQNSAKSWPDMKKKVVDDLPQPLRESAEGAFGSVNAEALGKWGSDLGKKAMDGVASFVVFLVMVFYLMIDGKKIYEWLLAFFPSRVRTKVRNTGDEMARVFRIYAAGQALTSLIAALFVYAVLWFLHVPAALLVGVLAGVLDVLPVLGFVISGGLAVLLALNVSAQSALIVAVVYLAYHLFENYVLVPRVYGRGLRLSTFTVLFGILAGGILWGVLGALAVIPILASYSAIEAIWLAPYLKEGVPEAHERQKDREFGSKPEKAAS